MGRNLLSDDAPPAYPERASRRGPSPGQLLVASAIAAGLIWAAHADGELTLILAILAFQLGFLAKAAWRAVLLSASLRRTPRSHEPADFARYTVLVALFDEAEIVPQLIGRLSEIDYPPDRLEGFLILEADDHITRDAIEAIERPDWLSIVIAPHDGPRTKPRALNAGLARATGELVTVYDAEDHPDPLQLREAAARFASERAKDLWALQAPLRVRLPFSSDTPFLDRQFAIEYASLFEVSLPGLARLGLPFPLGGTSNHFRVDALRLVGGWDDHNVTEDADLGFRIWRAGGRLDVLTRPTYEPPPGGLDHWLPQRTRWLKGFMQTWGVHTRDVRGLGWRGGLSLTMTLGAAIASAALHAVSLAWLLTTVLIAMAAELTPETPNFAVGVLVVGALAAFVNAAIGCRRAGLDFTITDMVCSPAYWSLLSLAFFHAAWRLISEPFAWDKTAHFADPAPLPQAVTGRKVE